MLIIGAYSAFAFGILYVIFKMKSRARQRYEELAPRFGGTANIPKVFFGGSPSLEAIYRRRRLKIFEYAKGAGNSRRTYTAVEVAVSNSTNLGFTIRKRGFLTRWLMRWRASEVQTGDLVFDDLFVIKGSDGDLLQQVLTPTVKGQLIKQAEAHVRFDMRLKGDTLRNNLRGSLARNKVYEVLPTLVDSMNDLADQLAAVQGFSKR